MDRHPRLWLVTEHFMAVVKASPMTLTSVLSPFVLLPQQFLGSSSQVWGHKLTLMGLLALVAAGGCLIGA